MKTILGLLTDILERIKGPSIKCEKFVWYLLNFIESFNRNLFFLQGRTCEEKKSASDIFSGDSL